MCLQFPELGDECSFISSAVAVWHEQQTLLPAGVLQLSGLFFLHSLQEDKYQTGLFGSFFITCSTHMGRWELIFHREPLVSGYSASSLAEDLMQGIILLEGAMLQWVYFVWFYLEVEVVGTVCYLADCLFWAQVLQVMLVDISSPNLPAMSHLAQLMPAKCKPWKCKIKPFLIIQQHLSLPGLPSFFFWVPLMEHH